MGPSYSQLQLRAATNVTGTADVVRRGLEAQGTALARSRDTCTGEVPAGVDTPNKTT